MSFLLSQKLALSASSAKSSDAFFNFGPVTPVFLRRRWIDVPINCLPPQCRKLLTTLPLDTQLPAWRISPSSFQKLPPFLPPKGLWALPGSLLWGGLQDAVWSQRGHGYLWRELELPIKTHSWVPVTCRCWSSLPLGEVLSPCVLSNKMDQLPCCWRMVFGCFQPSCLNDFCQLQQDLVVLPPVPTLSQSCLANGQDVL